MKAYCEEQQAVLDVLQTTKDGLSAQQAVERLRQNGKNQLAAAPKTPLWVRFLEQLKDPMILILLAAALVSGILAVVQNESFADVIIILAVVLINAVLGVFQESKAEKAIEALQQLSAATSKVLRDGELQIVPSEELTVGDVVALEAGDAVPADGRILECASLKVEEAALTGESVPVSKTAAVIAAGDGKEIPLGDRKNMAYMGSSVSYGRARMVVTAVGMQTEMGKIASALTNAKEGKTPLQQKLSGLSKILTWLVLAICVVVFAVQLFKAGSFSFDFILNSFMIAISLAVAAIPEGLAAVVTVVLSIGVTNMSHRNAIIRKLTAVETLGCAQIICSDKTGTLTQNKMTVVSFFGDNEAQAAAAMALCSDAELHEDGTVTGEPTEAALVAWAHIMGKEKYDLKKAFVRCAEAPFDSERKMMSTVHRTENGIIQYTKGAPDMILQRCAYYRHEGKILPMTDEVRAAVLRQNKAMADRALRVLACAERLWESVPADCAPEALEQELCFLGICGMIDPIRPEVQAAIVQCRSAGIRPIMITGDHVDTAVAIAKDLGILSGTQKAITGAQLDEMSDEVFAKEFRNISVYARVQPEHKTRIVHAWQGAGYITAMTGDGVNDAPSIKAADIGVGMGITGTDVTKNVADMVLADDNFASIVGAVEEGRRIYDNIRKAIQFLLGSNMSEVLSIFFSSLLGFTILKPVHLLWLNLVTDCFPALALGLEKAERDVMQRKPRDTKAGIFAGGLGVDVLYQGVLLSLLTFISYFIGMRMETGTWAITNSAHGMTMAFLTMSMAEVFHSFNMRSQRKSLFSLQNVNMALILSAVGTVLITAAVCEIPFLSAAFGFTTIGLGEYLTAAAIGLSIVPLVEAVKGVQRMLGKREKS